AVGNPYGPVVEGLEIKIGGEKSSRTTGDSSVGGFNGFRTHQYGQIMDPKDIRVINGIGPGHRTAISGTHIEAVVNGTLLQVFGLVCRKVMVVGIGDIISNAGSPREILQKIHLCKGIAPDNPVIVS